MKKRLNSHRPFVGWSSALFILVAVLLIYWVRPLQEPSLPKSQSTSHSVAPLATAGVNQITDRGLTPHNVKATVARKYGQLPLSFEPNVGQADEAVKFLSRGPGYTLLLTHTDAEVALQSAEPQGFKSETERLLQRMDSKQLKHFAARKFFRTHPRFRSIRKTRDLRIGLVAANGAATIDPVQELPGKSNYFIGSNPKKWRVGIPQFGEVEYREIYPGIDLKFYGNGRQLEFDFVAAPGANPNAIRLKVSGASHLVIANDGSLSLGTPNESLELRRPEIYQVEGGMRHTVQGEFVLRGNNEVGIQLGSYDQRLPLIIDPILSYSTYLGGNGADYAGGIAVDAQGNAYIAGTTTSTNFPLMNAYSTTANASGLAFVAKLDPTGTTLLYSTYLGGTGGEWDSAGGLALDPSGNVYVAGTTSSSDFPVVNGFQTDLLTSHGNAFVARIDTTQAGIASLVYSSYIGGGGNTTNTLGDVGLGIAADANGNAYVTGQTVSDSSKAPFPTTNTALQSTLASPNGNAFLTVVNTNQPGFGSLIYSTYLGGGSAGFGDYGIDVRVDNNGNAYITGQTASASPTGFPITSTAYQSSLNSNEGNAFVTEIATTQSGSQGLVYSTYLGGSTTVIIGDSSSSVALDSSGLVYISGDAMSSDFPTTTGAFQTSNSANGRAFLSKLDFTQSGSNSLVYSTFLGGTDGGQGEVAYGVAVDANGDAFVSGSTSSTDFPTTGGALQTTIRNSSWDAFVAKINPTGSGLLYGSYVGGSCANGDFGSALAVDSIGNPYVAGSTCSTDYPVYPTNAYQTALAGTYNAFIAKFALNPNPGITGLLSPAANVNGWNNSAATVSFLCIPGGAPIQSCPSQTTVSSQGANQVISGAVTDTASLTATASVTVNLDLTPPVLNVSSPTNGATVTSSALTVTGTATDSLSGVSGVMCNAIPATLSGPSFSCSLTLSSALTSIVVSATDLAGNTTTTTINVTLAVPGGSTPTGTLGAARQSHTATLLTNGTVLIAGGFGPSGDLASALLYSPATGTFSATGSMTTPRASHTATLLNNGMVLLAGGFDSSGNPMASAELFNPITGTFTATGIMSTGRSLHTATLLNDGTVLIAGGFDSSFNALASAELYDPATGMFSGVGSLGAGRTSHTGTLLNNGQVLLAGGTDAGGNALSDAELYDPNARTFSSTGSLNSGRGSHTATLLNNGLVLVLGGVDINFNTLASAELYDPTAGTFSVTGSLSNPRNHHTQTLLNNGTVLVAGGTDGFGDVFSTEIFDPTSQTFTSTNGMQNVRFSHSATRLIDGTVLFAGGIDSSFLVEASSEVYTATSLTPPGLASIALSPSTPTMSVGTAQRFTATGTFGDSSTQVLSSVTWSSSDNTLATVTNDSSNTGQANGVGVGSVTITACAGSVCGSTGTTVAAGGLSITGLTPNSGAVGAPVIVAGTGFGATKGSSTVAFNGTAATVSLWSDTGIVTSVPTGATTGNVVVTESSVNSNGVLFTVSSAPVITSLSPTSGVAGTSVTIAGSNFGASQGTSTVTFNGMAATVSNWSAGSISATVPNAATTGNVVVSASGVASNGVRFVVPSITEITPTSGAVGELVTILGSGFGAIQGTGSAKVNGTPLVVLSWSDGQIAGAVGSGTTSGVVTVQQGAITITGPSFTITSAFPYNVSPLTLNMLVGQSRTVSVKDGSGNTITGLHWITSDPTIVSLSTDDPPILTAVAVGSATIYAGVVPISVTVFTGSSLPSGTPIWSLPLTGSALGEINPVPAVPSTSGVDVFAVDGSGGLTAITGDGTVQWRAGVELDSSLGAFTNQIIPDFSGGVFAKEPYIYTDGQGNFHRSYTLKKVTPGSSTALLSPLYTFLGDVTPPGSIEFDGIEVAIPDTTGVVFIQDSSSILGSTVSVLNPTTGQSLASVSLENSTINTIDLSEVDAPEFGKMIVAGDGNAYLPYAFKTVTETGDPASTTDTKTIYHLVVLRISPDGTYAKTQLATGTDDVFGVNGGNGSEQCSGYLITVNAPNISLLSVITNADTGALVFADGVTPCGSQQSSQVMYFVSKDAVSSQATVQDGPFLPVLQRADGSYVGTVGRAEVLAIGLDGSTLWQQTVTLTGSNQQAIPSYATSDGGVTVTTTQNGQLGTLYTLDQNGNINAQSSDIGYRPSWLGQWYANPAGTISDISLPPLQLAPTFAAISQGNHSGNGTAIDQVQTNETQGNEDQIPAAGASTRSNYNSIELLTDVSPDDIFAVYMQTYEGVKGGNNDVATVNVDADVTQVNQKLTFTLQSVVASQPVVWIGLGQGPFSVRVNRFNPTTHTIAAVTQKRHPLAGWRYWRVFSVGTNDVVVETGAIDTNAPGPLNYVGFYYFKAEQVRVWEEDFQFILKSLAYLGARQGKTPRYNIVKGVFNFDDNYIQQFICRTNVCN